MSAAFSFRLFLAGDTPNSTQALANLTALCRERLPECHTIEIVDVLAQPERALEEGVFLTPMVIKMSPGPHTRIVGTLSNARAVAQALGLGLALGPT